MIGESRRPTDQLFVLRLRKNPIRYYTWSDHSWTLSYISIYGLTVDVSTYKKGRATLCLCSHHISCSWWYIYLELTNGFAFASLTILGLFLVKQTLCPTCSLLAKNNKLFWQQSLEQLINSFNCHLVHWGRPARRVTRKNSNLDRQVHTWFESRQT